MAFVMRNEALTTSETTMTNPDIASSIYRQIGHSALYMMGAKNLVDQGDGLSFRIRGSKRINHVRVILDEGSDTYRVELSKIGRAPLYKTTTVVSVEGIYAEGITGSSGETLNSILQSETGLALSL